jgi:hypothetical protein
VQEGGYTRSLAALPEQKDIAGSAMIERKAGFAPE